MVSTLSLSGVSFSTANQRSFDAWGNIRGGSASGDPKGRYCASLGHKQDDESGLIYMRARYYDPTSGRFVSQDPKHSGANWFVYGDDEPVDNVDANGQDTSDWLLFIAGMLLAVEAGQTGDYLSGGIGVFVSIVSLQKALKSGEGSSLEKTIENEEDVLNSPEEDAAEESLAGPAVRDAALESGEIAGELLVDEDLDNGGGFMGE